MSKILYLPPVKHEPLAAPNVDRATDIGIKTAATPKTLSPQVYK